MYVNGNKITKKQRCLAIPKTNKALSSHDLPINNKEKKRRKHYENSRIITGIEGK